MIVDRLISLRKSKKYTQESFSKQLGIPRSTYSNYEAGNREPDNITLKLIAEKLETTTDYLLGLTDNPENKATVTVAGQSISLSSEELHVFKELVKHQAMFHDLATDPERKVKQLIKLYKMKKIFFEEDDEEYGDGFGEFKD